MDTVLLEFRQATIQTAGRFIKAHKTLLQTLQTQNSAAIRQAAHTCELIAQDYQAALKQFQQYLTGLEPSERRDSELERVGKLRVTLEAELRLIRAQRK